MIKTCHTGDSPEEERRAVEDRRRYFTGCPKYEHHELSEDQITQIVKQAVKMAKEEFAEEIAERAVEIAETKFYINVGKVVTGKVFLIVGVASVVAYTWLTSGKFPAN